MTDNNRLPLLPPPIPFLQQHLSLDVEASPEPKKIALKVTKDEVDELMLSFALMKVCFSDQIFSDYLSNKLDMPRGFTNKYVLKPNSKLCDRLSRQMELSEKKSLGRSSPKKATYFTQSIPATKDVKELYEMVDTEDLKLRYDQKSETSSRDVYSMVKKYISTRGLIKGDLIVLDDFLQQRVSDKQAIVGNSDSDEYFLVNSNKSLWNITKYIVNKARETAP